MTLLDTPKPRAGLSPNAMILIGAVIALGGTLTIPTGLTGFLTFAFVALAWVLSVGIHEFGHAFVAWKAGDTTIIDKGYLTLDPLKYTDLSTTLILPLVALALGGIGFPGGAVYLRNDLMRSPGWRALASLAGPAGTLVVLIAIAVLMPLTAGAPALHQALALLAFLQASALVLNLLPVPGLDGYGVIRPFLPTALAERLAKFEAISFLVLFGVIFFVPGVSDVIFGLAALIAALLGVSPDAMQAGWASFHFWK
ncbi:MULTISPECIES: site-2 protease family protein [unclassified Caulobacter]|uniref:site-2 protease family protein n=1 Tax=unclassified Caulobacter TaxID=2648921 RepID=UPI000D38CB68|nr:MULTISPECIES: site-2 protease family protein [unclassified Caulobacter]PTS88554.1 site-2 protease family protein [Caulobacter sp. HMWF009]PTT09675.1 site-2 protease family protein [Caulobacter sp. HMWF025]